MTRDLVELLREADAYSMLHELDTDEAWLTDTDVDEG